MRHTLRLALLLALAPAAGCGSKSPSAELVSWHTTSEPLQTGGKALAPGPTSVFLLVRIRATGKELYRPKGVTNDVAADSFSLTAGDGEPIRGEMVRIPPAKEYVAMMGKAKNLTVPDVEEVEVLFIVPQSLADRADLVVRYPNLPKVALDPAKKEK